MNSVKMDQKIVDEIEKNISGLQSENDKIRDKHFKILYPLSNTNPELLYPYWDLFADMLCKPEVSNKYYAILLIANLVCMDTENKFDKIFDLWFHDLLNHESPVVSPHIAEKSGKIVKAKPEIEKKVTSLLLNISKTSQCRHLDLQIAYVLSAFEMYFDIISEKNTVITYIKEEQHNPSSKTRKKALELIKKYKIR